MSIRVSVLAGGSRGNSIVVNAGGTTLLFDAGLSGKEIGRRMAMVGEDLDSVKGLFISHEHNDHISGAGVVHRRHGIPLYMTRGTADASADRLGRLGSVTHITPGESVLVGEARVLPFRTNHDAADPVGFIVRHAGHSLGIATDLGCPTHIVRNSLKGCDILVLESNHDRHMLMTGPYPPELKTRINSRIGHLANDACGDLLAEVISSRTRFVVLTHLSEENNHRDLAIAEARRALGTFKSPFPVELVVAQQDEPTLPVEVQ